MTKVGPDHRATLTTKHNLGALYKAQGKYDQAERLYLAVLEKRTATLGTDHPDTLATKNNLAMLYLDQERYDRAEPLFREVVLRLRDKLSSTAQRAAVDTVTGYLYPVGGRLCSCSSVPSTLRPYDPRRPPIGPAPL
jgi:tetratricopeptide (TPR) repeat protein